MPVLSFVITVYNCENYVLEAVGSALRQDLTDIEIVVVDDGSTDGTRAALDSLRDGRLRILSPGRIGRAKALNFGVRHALGKYVAILDADDVSLPRRASLSVAFLQANPDTALVGSRYRSCVDGNGTPVREDIEPVTWEGIIGKLKQYGNPLFHSSVTLDREKLLSVGGYDETLACLLDWDIYVRLAKRYPLHNLDERLAFKRIHELQYFGGRDGVHFQSEAAAARQIVHERIRELP